MQSAELPLFEMIHECHEVAHRLVDENTDTICKKIES
jgi:hypothetical protein